MSANSSFRLPTSPKRVPAHIATLLHMRETSGEPEVKLWRVPNLPDLQLIRIEGMRRARTSCSENYAIVMLQEGAYESWYRGELRVHGAGELRLKEPGHVSRGLRVLEPVTMQVASFTARKVEQAAAALGRRAPTDFGAGRLAPGSRAAELAFAMHAALACPQATALAQETLVTETLAEVMLACSADGQRASTRAAPRAVRRAREYLHDTFDSKVTLDALAAHAELDKYHLVRAFRREVGLPPYEYLTHLRVARASTLLARGVSPSEVALVVGLYDESQLNRHFRRIVGTTPGRYARAMKPTALRQLRPIRPSPAAASFGS